MSRYGDAKFQGRVSLKTSKITRSHLAYISAISLSNGCWLHAFAEMLKRNAHGRDETPRNIPRHALSFDRGFVLSRNVFIDLKIEVFASSLFLSDHNRASSKRALCFQLSSSVFVSLHHRACSHGGKTNSG